MVDAVDRHPGVVQQGAAGDHHFGVAVAHPVVGDHRRLDPGPTSSRSSRRAMLRTICMWTQEWSDIPSRSAWTWVMYHQARTCVVAVDRVEEALQLAIAPRRRPHPRLGDRLFRRFAVGPLGSGAGTCSSLIPRIVCERSGGFRQDRRPTVRLMRGLGTRPPMRLEHKESPSLCNQEFFRLGKCESGASTELAPPVQGTGAHRLPLPRLFAGVSLQPFPTRSQHLLALRPPLVGSSPLLPALRLPTAHRLGRWIREEAPIRLCCRRIFPNSGARESCGGAGGPG